MTAQRALERLDAVLHDLGPVAVAFSGGLDSVVLSFRAGFVHGTDRVRLFIGTGEIFPPSGVRKAQAAADALGLAHELVPCDQLSEDDFMRNDERRCYVCKRHMYRRLTQRAHALGYETVVDGTSLTDVEEGRPSFPAHIDEGIETPLATAMLTREDIKAIAELFRLPMNVGIRSCLAHPYSYGFRFDPALFRRLHGAEAILIEQGIDVELQELEPGVVAVRLADTDQPALFDATMEDVVRTVLRTCGYERIVVPVGGYTDDRER